MKWGELFLMVLSSSWAYAVALCRAWWWDRRSWWMPLTLRWRGMTYHYPRRKMWEWTANLPFKEIKEDGREYLQRYFLKEFTVRGKRYIAYLHFFVADDPGRGPHNHKWRAWSWVLVGWYWEHFRWCVRKVRWFNRITPDTFHRVTLDGSPFHQTTCWTLFIHEAENSLDHWGFWSELNDPDSPDAALYIPYKYPEGVQGAEAKWWLTAPCRPKDKQLSWY